MARSDPMKFWKLLADAKFTGSPSKLSKDDLRQMGRKACLFEHEVETLIRGYREMLKSRKGDGG